jgi:hypothetical protein
MKECPMCGGRMRLNVREIPEAIPGQVGATPVQRREWICPDCDYFEEAEPGET